MLRYIPEEEQKPWRLKANTISIHLLQKALELRGFEPPSVKGTFHQRGSGNNEASYLTLHPKTAPNPAPKLHYVVQVVVNNNNHKMFHRSSLQNMYMYPIMDGTGMGRGRSPRRSPPRIHATIHHGEATSTWLRRIRSRTPVKTK